ncbi:MAG TPA: helix-turn-helix domain-containing protein [Verrucomicrobiae bacterium]|nr:helix-turn-helix domain-containing protein [Verrucomicrobiae bacterium]
MSTKTQTNEPAAVPQPKLAYTREEAAVQLSCHPMTISRLTERGLLRPSRATRRPIYSHEELQRFLRETASQPVKK